MAGQHPDNGGVPQQHVSPAAHEFVWEFPGSLPCHHQPSLGLDSFHHPSASRQKPSLSASRSLARRILQFVHTPIGTMASQMPTKKCGTFRPSHCGLPDHRSRSAAPSPQNPLSTRKGGGGPCASVDSVRKKEADMNGETTTQASSAAPAPWASASSFSSRSTRRSSCTPSAPRRAPPAGSTATPCGGSRPARWAPRSPTWWCASARRPSLRTATSSSAGWTRTWPARLVSSLILLLLLLPPASPPRYIYVPPRRQGLHVAGITNDGDLRPKIEGNKKS